MKRPSLSELELRFGRKEAAVWPWCLGMVTGMLVPAMVVVAGWIVELLNLSRRATFPDSIRLGQWLSIPSTLIGASQSPLRGLLTMVAILVILALIESLALLVMYRWGIRYAIDMEVWLRTQLFRTHVSQATLRGVAGQMTSWNDADVHWIPEIREGVAAWYRSFHRYTIQAFVCLLLAVLVHPLLMLLTFIAFVLVWRLYRTLDQKRRRGQPVFPNVVKLSLKSFAVSPFMGHRLSAIHSSQTVENRIDGLLRSFRDAETQLGFGDVWRIPFLATIVAIIVGMFCVVLSVQLLKPDSPLDVAAALTMLGLISFGYLSVVKVARSYSRHQGAESAAHRMLGLLSQFNDSTASSSLPTAPPIRRSLELEKVSISDANGQKLLDEISLRASPGYIVAIVSSQSQSASALAELIIGFGQPESGRILWDERLLRVLIPIRC